VIVQCNKNITM